LAAKYGPVKWLVLSNRALFTYPVRPAPRERISTLGFLSNLTYEKGTSLVIDLAREMKLHGMKDMRIIIAGPCHDLHLVEELKRAQSEELIEWWGPVYGPDKERFWKETDVFLFPTRYPNEAEPLVVWESFAAACPVIAPNRGCISGQIRGAGLCVPPEEDFGLATTRVLNQWRENPGDFTELSSEALNRIEHSRIREEQHWHALVDALRGCNASNDQQ
ncbi:MAG: glycosyltransferase, partial [Acidobacteriota bacterium]